MVQAEKELDGVIEETVDFGYDVDGVRVKKTVDGSDIYNFLVDKNREFSQVIEEIDGSGSLTCSYVHGLDLISQNRVGDVSYYHYDGQHSTRKLTDNNGQLTDSYTFDAFGLLLNRSGATENNYLFTGEQYDPNLGFYYLRARYYNPEIGRFTTIDPWKGSIYDPVSLHKYLYCGNDPVDFVDWSGEVFLLDLAQSIYHRGLMASKELCRIAYHKFIASIMGGLKSGVFWGLLAELNAQWAKKDFDIKRLLAAALVGGIIGIYAKLFINFIYPLTWVSEFIIAFSAGLFAVDIVDRAYK
jgi:RHS repeat-associated protein